MAWQWLGFIKGWELGKLTNYEEDFAYPGFDHLEEVFLSKRFS